MSRRLDLTGKTFGRLTVSGFGHVRGQRTIWRCVCSCGNLIEVIGKNLANGNTSSCGCLHSDEVRTRLTTHGLTHSTEFNSWRGMIERCTSPVCGRFKDYGGRGIQVCERWLSFQAFITDMGMKPTPKHTIERENNEGNYEPGNCIWATRAVQSLNRRANRVLELNGQSKCLKQWAAEYGMDYYTIHSRIKRGWSVADAITTPVKRAA